MNSNLQFSKGFPKGFVPVYPIDRAQIREVARLSAEQGGNGLVSLRVGKSHGASCPVILRSDEGLRAALDDVMSVRKLVEIGEYPFAVMRKNWPDDFGSMPENFPAALADAHKVLGLERPVSFDDPQACAQIVRMDQPGDLHRVMHPWMLSQGFVYKSAQMHSFDFAAMTAADDAEAAAARSVALEKAFEVKAWRGIARPEEVAGYNMTAYPEGCPGHAESWAGHAAFSESTARHYALNWREVGSGNTLRPLPSEAIRQIVWHGFCFSMWRLFAGVHYPVSCVEPFGEAHEYGFGRD